MDALAFLKTSNKARHQPIYVLMGDEEFLKRQCRDAIFKRSLDQADPAYAVTTSSGDKLDFSTVRNHLDTLPFLSPYRIINVENADTFVTNHRAALEKYVSQPASHGVLILDVKTFPETTKLAKALPDSAKIVCKSPPSYKLPGWCMDWSRSKHKSDLSTDAAEMLVQLVGTSLGMLDQELAKLAVACAQQESIGADDVLRYVGRSRSADVFKIMDAIGSGDAATAITILEELFAEGEDPLAVLGPLTWQLRQLASVGRFLSDGQSLAQALEAASIPRFRLEQTEQQVRWLGRRRLDKLVGWLVEINLGLKGGNPLPERLQLERLIVRLARPREVSTSEPN